MVFGVLLTFVVAVVKCRFDVVGRSFFSPFLGKPGTLGSGTEYWRGYYQSLRPTQMGLSLNIGWLFYFSKYILISVYICLIVNTSLSALNNAVFVH